MENLEKLRTPASAAVLALALAAGGCSLLGQNHRCEPGPAPGPDRPDAEEPDRIGGLALADTTSHLPCDWDE